MEKIKEDDWIALKERKPEDDLICLITDGHNLALVKTDIWQDGRLWWDCQGFSGYEFEIDFEPTHWIAFSAELP